LQQAATALAAAKNTGGGGFSGGADLAVAQKKTDDAAARAFDSARRAASAVGDPAGTRRPCSPRSTPAAQQYASLAATSRSLVGSVQRGIGSLSAAVGALGAAQRVQAQSAYDLAQSTVDSLTLRAPIAGVVQFGGVRAASSGGGSLGDLLGSIAGGGAGAAAARLQGGGGANAAGPGGGRRRHGGRPGRRGYPDRHRRGRLVARRDREVDETDVLLVSPGVPANVELDAAPGAGYPAIVQNVDLLPTTSTSGGVAYRVRLSLGPGRYSDGRPAAHAPAGHERGGTPVGAAGARHGDSAGRGGVLGRRARRGLAGTRRARGAGSGDRGRAGAGPGGDRGRDRGGATGSWCAAPTRSRPGSPAMTSVAVTSAVEARDVTRVYQLDGVGVPALRGVVTMTVPAGDYLAIVGPSGSGKSTLMHLLGGLDRPTSGQLLIGGRDVSRLTAPQMAELRNRTIGFVFQSFHLLPRTTAVDNVALPLVYAGLRAGERRRRATEMLDRVGLGHRLRQPAQPALRRRAAAGGHRPGADRFAQPAAGRRDPPANLDSTTGAGGARPARIPQRRVRCGGRPGHHDHEVAARARRQIRMRDGLVVSDSSTESTVDGQG